jgi:hypothetical protein
LQRFVEDSAFLDKVYQEEEELLSNAYTNKSLGESRIIVSPTVLLFLAAMHQSLVCCTAITLAKYKLDIDVSIDG